MRITRKHVVGAAVAVTVAAGSGAALAVSRSSSPAAERDAFLADVANRLDVSVGELESALEGAARATVDRALAEGRITEEQARRLRERLESGHFFEGRPRHGGPGFGHGRHGSGRLFGNFLGAAADYVGLSRAELRDRLRDGASLADVARAQGKAVDGLKLALRNVVAARLDRAVASGRLTQARKQELLSRFDAKLDALVERGLPGR